MSTLNEKLLELAKALDAGSYNVAPSALAQGAALQTEDLSPVMEVVTFEDKAIKFQKKLDKRPAHATLVQFNRQLDYGIFGGSAQYEGGIGEEDTSSYQRAVVPIAFYSTVRRHTLAAQAVKPFDGVKAEERVARDAAKKLAADIEFDLFHGMAHFSNLGVFDGSPAVLPALPNMRGLDQQVRESDALANALDLMFAEFGADQSVIVAVNGALGQTHINEAAIKSAMAHGAADTLYLDPVTLGKYNEIAFAKERIFLAGAPQKATGAALREQWTALGAVALEASRFLSGKTSPARARAGSPAAPSSVTAATAADSASVLPAGTYIYRVTAVNERGESVPADASAVTVAAGQRVDLTIAAVTGAKYFNVYRSVDGGGAETAKFIGRVKAAGAGNTTFRDLGNKLPGFVTGYLAEHESMEVRELAPFSKLDLAITDLSKPKAFYRFLALVVTIPRHNVILENIDGQLS